MHLGVLKELGPHERRVALVPESLKKLASHGFTAAVEIGAGTSAGFTDDEYRAVGAKLGNRREALRADAIVGVNPRRAIDLGTTRGGALLIGLLQPTTSCELMAELASHDLSGFALELVPRTSLAQSMDVLSSQANLAGYWAVVAAAARLPRIFPLLMTAAGTITPARVLVMGVGVAGLAAIGTARRLGAVVEATDVRPETKEQVESLGARFLSVEGAAAVAGAGGYAGEQSADYRRAQAELISAAIRRADVVITTAQVPGRRAPRLVSDEQVASMRRGSVIVDLAATQGGNVAGAPSQGEVVRHGVLIIGPASAPSQVAFHASQAFSRNVEQLLLHLAPGGTLRGELDDDIARGCLVTHRGAVVHPGVRAACDIEAAA